MSEDEADHSASEKLDLETPNFTDQNIARIAELFPNVVTETRDANGTVRHAIDFDALKQELSEDELVDGPQERYHLNWPGKRKAMLAANAPINKTLRPARDESVDFDTTKNLFIEGDNLDALKLLQETYLGKVKMIYIDPPYNTGKDFIYKDNFTVDKDEYLEESGQRDEVGGRLIANPESKGRYHSDWLSMIYPRLKLARNLLRDDGAIFISIGQEEISSLSRLCFEVFGEQNFITTCSRVMKTGGQKGTHFSPSVDYIVAFAKNIGELGPFREPISQNVIEKVYTRVEQSGERKGEKYRAVGLYQAMLDVRANQRYFVKCPDGTLVIPPGSSMPAERSEGEQVTPKDGDGVWRWTYGRLAKERDLNNLEFVESDRSSLITSDGKAAKWNVYYKIWLSDRMRDGQLPGNILGKFESRHSSAELKKLEIPFDFAKPSALIQYLMTLICVDEGDYVLDFFAGSASTGHAAMEMGAAIGRNVPFICVQLPEGTGEKSEAFKKGFETIADISKERIRRAGSKILSEKPNQVGKLDVGFRVLKIGSSNMTDVWHSPESVSQNDLLSQVSNIKPDRKGEDLLFQVLLDWGVDLTLPIVSEQIEGKAVFMVGGNALTACFETGISESLVKHIAAREPLRVVFREDGFESDAMRINVGQLFKHLSPHTEFKVI